MTKQTRHQPREKVCNNSHLTLTTMARLQGISGGMSGRTGSFTYRQSRGETIVSQYQPMVKNPNTEKQQDQRARFKLLSQLAAIMAPGFGTMGVTKRPGKQRPTQRNAFMQINMPLVEVASTADTATAKIPMEQLKLTSSNRYLPQINLTDTKPDIEVSFENMPAEVTSVRVVLVGYRGQGQTQAFIKSIADYPVTPNQQEFNVTLLAEAGNYTVLAFGLIPTESTKSSVDLDNIHTPADENFISAVELNAMVAEGSMLETMTVGANVTITNE